MSKGAKFVADKYEKALEQNEEGLEELAEKDKLIKKEAELVIKRIKNNWILLQRVRLFKSTKIKVVGKPFYNLRNEPVYKVLKIGDITDDYVTKVKVGDLVMCSNVVEYKHNGVTEAKLDTGEYAGFYGMAHLNDVILVVDYKLKE